MPEDKELEQDGQKERNRHRFVLYGIIAGVIIGILFGGLFPGYAVHTKILGQIFLHALKMIVVPLVMLSMIVGITGLGHLGELGSIGWRTILYYMVTTGVSVAIGLILVNIVKPGKGLTPGEEQPEVAYSIGGEANRTVTLDDGALKDSGYDRDWVVELTDQQIRGTVKSASGNTVTVERWQHPKEEFRVTASNGVEIPMRTVDGRLLADEPEVEASGRGLAIRPSPRKVRGKEEASVGQTLRRVLIGMIPTNVFKSMAEMDVLPLIVFSLLFGAALSSLGSRGKPAVEVISAMNDGIMQVVWWVMMVAPIGILGLIAARIGAAGGFEGFWPQLAALGKYSLTVVVGLAAHAFVVLPLILWLFTRTNPWRYGLNMGAALLNAFSTASSSATLPLTMQGVEKENKVSNRTASFVLPLGATINMDGTALYEAVAAMFIAQVYGIEISPAGQVIVFLTATLAAIGAAGIPEAGLVTMVIVLKAVNLPIEGIGLILAVDWLLDRFRTTVNVWGDSVGAAVIDRAEARAGGPS